MFAGNDGGLFGGRLSVCGVAEVCRIFSVFDSVVSGRSLSVGSSTRMGSILSVASDSHYDQPFTGASHVTIDESFSVHMNACWH